MRRSLMAMAVLLAISACTGGGNGSPSTEPDPEPSTSPVGASGPLMESRCPVSDDAFCAVAVDVAEALTERDDEALFALSRRDRIVCADVAREYFPGCRSKDVLRGHGSGGPDFIVEILDEQAYRGQIDAILGALDPTYSDELGDGSVRFLGVGTCGPNVPNRRTYHLAWTAAASEPGGPVERLLSSFELIFADGEWRIALWYLGPLDEWEAEQADPLANAFCEAGRSPWR
jgi:hypothetical protein